MLFRCDCGKEASVTTTFAEIYCDCGRRWKITGGIVSPYRRYALLAPQPRKTMILPDKECGNCQHAAKEDSEGEIFRCFKFGIFPRFVCFHDVCSHYQPK